MLADGEPHLAALGELDRITQQVDQDLAHARGIAHHHQRGGQLISIVKAQAACLNDGMHEIGQFLGQLRRFERLLHQFQLAGLDARQIERVVDQPQQMRTRLADRIDMAALFCVQRRGQQQLAHAQHAGHGRAHFMPSVARKFDLAIDACSASC